MRILSTIVFLAAALLAQAAPLERPRLKALILDGQNNHDWRATTPVLVAILENSGRFSVDVATATDVVKYAPNFSAYDVVVSNYNGRPWPKATCDAFEKYVQGGGGFVSVHAANNAFTGWRVYNEIIGLGGWGGRNEKSGPYVRFRDGKIVRDASAGRGGGHGRQHEFVVTHRAEHPILAGLPSSWKHARDELYDKLRGPAQNLTVLATAWSDPKTRGTGEHEPMLMTVDYGEGRVFHTTLGHGAESMRGVGFQITLQRGAEWAATGSVTITATGVESLSESDAAKRDALAIARRRQGWVALFDGESLRGWKQQGGTARYRVEKAAIVGKTSEGSPNSFLCTEKAWADFELRFEVKVDDALNSGVQIRSRTREGGDRRVHGPQVEIATNGTAGFVYGEALGTGWLSKDRTDAAKKAAFREGKWNSYRVLAVGPSIRTWVNGIPVADLHDEVTKMTSGFIGLQVHGVARETGPYEVRWRKLWIRDLTKKPAK